MQPRARQTQTLRASEARQRFSEVVDRVFRHEGRVLIEKSGIPVAAIVPAKDLERLEQLDADLLQSLDLLARMREPFSGISEEQITRDVAETIADLRAEDDAALSVAEPPITFDKLYGSIPPIPGRETDDSEDFIRVAMDDRADEIVRRLESQ